MKLPRLSGEMGMMMSDTVLALSEWVEDELDDFLAVGVVGDRDRESREYGECRVLEVDSVTVIVVKCLMGGSGTVKRGTVEVSTVVCNDLVVEWFGLVEIDEMR